MTDSSPRDAVQTHPAPDAASPTDSPGDSARFHRYPVYSPRFWHGMRPGGWWGLLREGRFQVHPSRWSTAASVTLATPVNTVGAWLQQAWWGRRLAESELHGPPVFIIGHWRSGTTLLHELMVRDERLSSPSTFQCFAPHHFLVSEWFFRRFANWLLPERRPMDNMAAGWDRPQEDEFALLNLGLPSPYRRIAFPNQGAVDLDYLTLENVTAKARKRWMRSLREFLEAVSLATGRPLVIKSPTHTARIRYLAREFPEAKFIHITRDPRALFPSTCRLWKSLDEVQALQRPDHDHLESYVIDCFRRMYDAFHGSRDSIEPHRLVDVRYEALIAEPVATMRWIYESLRLSDFEPVQPLIESWAEGEHRQYQPNRLKISASAEERIRDRWADYFERYGYGDTP